MVSFCYYELNLRISHLDPAIPLLGINPRDMKTCPHKTSIQVLIALSIIAKDGDNTNVHQLMYG